jgi:Uma2 family endonuclease
VSPFPDQPEDWIKEWVLYKLKQFAQSSPDIVKHTTGGARVFVHGRPKVTCPEPDVAAYRRFPLRKPIRDLRWQDVSPLVVAEVLSKDDAAKDQIRNVVLYREVPSIKEYWILDGRQDADKPSMTVYRRRGQAWRKPIDVGPGELYTTPLLPGFQLVLDTRS